MLSQSNGPRPPAGSIDAYDPLGVVARSQLLSAHQPVDTDPCGAISAAVKGWLSHGGEHPVATCLRSALAATHVEVIAEGAGCGQKLQIVVVSAQFEGKPLLKQHRMVNEAAKDELAKVHAFNVKSYTPAKWAARS